MKNTKTCPKCNCTGIIRIDGYSNRHGTGNNIYVTPLAHVKVNRYLCCQCGFSEEWVDTGDIALVQHSKYLSKEKETT